MGSNYFIEKGGQTFGPTSSFGLRTLVQAGKLAPTDLIWREGSERKVQAERVKGLSFASPTVVAPSPATVPEVSTPVQQVSPPPIYPVVSTTGFKRSSGSRSKSNLLAWNKMGLWLGIIGGIAALGLLVFAVTIFVNGEKSVEVENISTARVGYIIGDVRIDQAIDYPGSAASYKADVESLLKNRGFEWDWEETFSLSGSEVPAGYKRFYGEYAVMIVDTWWRSGNGSPGYLRLWWVHVPKRLAREVGGQDTPEEWLIHSIENADGQVYETGKTYFASEASNTEDANNTAGVVTERKEKSDLTTKISELELDPNDPDWTGMDRHAKRLLRTKEDITVEEFRQSVITLSEELARSVITSFVEDNRDKFISFAFPAKKEWLAFILERTPEDEKEQILKEMGEGYASQREEVLNSWTEIRKKAETEGCNWKSAKFVRVDANSLDIKVFISADGKTYELILDDCMVMNGRFYTRDDMKWNGFRR